MAAQKGREMIIKLGNGASPQTFTLIAGLRDTTLTISDTEVDITTKEDVGYRKLLEGRIIKSMAVSGTGVFKDDTVFNTLRAAMDSGTHYDYQIIVPGDNAAGGTFEGAFRITSLEISGAHDGEVQYSISLASDGNATFTLN